MRPRPLATLTALARPSSWKPWPRWAPANQVPRRPCRAAMRPWAAMAASSNTGWSNSVRSNTRCVGDLALGIEADEQGIFLVDALQPVHPVGDGDIGMEDIPVRDIDSSWPSSGGGAASRFRRGAGRRCSSDSGSGQRRLFLAVGVLQQRQGLVAMAGHHHLVVGLGAALGILDLHLAVAGGSPPRRAQLVRMRWAKGAVRRRTYSCDPPVTVRHCGWPVKDSR